ncbi:MAG: hypothetical protein V3U14_12935 [candidate division NC10 bacterium]
MKLHITLDLPDDWPLNNPRDLAYELLANEFGEHFGDHHLCISDYEHSITAKFMDG